MDNCINYKIHLDNFIALIEKKFTLVDYPYYLILRYIRIQIYFRSFVCQVYKGYDFQLLMYNYTLTILFVNREK